MSESLSPQHCLPLTARLDSRRLSSYFAYHSTDFLCRSATTDFTYKGRPGFAFGRFYSAPGFRPNDAEIFYIRRGRVGFYFSSSFSSTTDGVHAFIIKPNGITSFRLRFAFGYSTIGYVCKDIGEMLDRIFQIVRIISSQIYRSFRTKGWL